MRVFSIRSTHLEKGLINLGVDTITRYLDTTKRANIMYFLDAFVAARPDYFLFHKDEHLTRGILSALKQNSPKTKFIMAYRDQRGCIPPLILGRRGLIDILLINNEDPKQFKMYKDFGIPHVFTSHHCLPTDEFQEFDSPVPYDIFFGGNNFNHDKFPLSKHRYNFIIRVRDLFKNMVVYGSGWPFPTKKSVSRPTYAHVLRTAKINLGFNHYNVLRYYDRRLFECMGSGRLHITYYVPGMEKDFENHKHLVWFRTVKEGLNVIQNYLKYPEKREAVAAAGRKLICEKHSMTVRAKEFKDLLMSL